MSEFLAGDAEKQKRLKAIIKRLHAGASVAEVKRDFASLIHGVSAEEVAAMEQALVDEGFPVEEIQRLCEVHVEVFEASLEKGGSPRKMPGHPVHTFIEENKEARKRVRRLLRAARAWAWGIGGSAEAGAALEELTALIIHYTRKENQLFPYLEKKGFTGPSKVMWGKHDEIRALFKEAEAAYRQAEGRSGARAFLGESKRLSGAVKRMIFMEEKILYPNALKRLSEREWAEIRNGEDAIGFAWVRPGADYDAGIVFAREAAARKRAELEAKGSDATSPREAAGGQAPPPEASHAGMPPAAAGEPPRETPQAGDIPLNTGSLSPGLLDLVLRKLPFDISVVDESDRVLYYSDSPHRIFPRSPAVIGREVQNCHPPKSVATVERILDAFRKREKESARFWIRMGPKLVVIEYHALYGPEGKYKGTLEISYDATEIKALEGERRLLDWD